MSAIIRQICIGMPATVQHRGKDISTGIFKTPVDGPVRVTKLGIVGDGQADLTVHGGRDKAVYVYPSCHAEKWAAELGVEKLAPSQFGQNVDVSDLSEDTVRIGDRFRCANVEAVVSQPRLPCFKLGIRMNNDDFPARFLQTGRLGFYLRVEAEGDMQPGDTLECIETADHDITVTKLWRTVFGRRVDRRLAAECLQRLPYLDAGWRRRLEQRCDGTSRKESPS